MKEVLGTDISYKNGVVPKNIQVLIVKRGLKQCFVAERMGIHPQLLNDMLNGRRIIKPIDISNAAKALGVNVDELFAEDETTHTA